MSKHEDFVSLIKHRKRVFLPERGEGSQDPRTDYILNGLSTLCEVAYEATIRVARPVGALVRYIVVEAFKSVKH